MWVFKSFSNFWGLNIDLLTKTLGNAVAGMNEKVSMQTAKIAARQIDFYLNPKKNSVCLTFVFIFGCLDYRRDCDTFKVVVKVYNDCFFSLFAIQKS